MKQFSLLLLSFFCCLAQCLAQETIEGRIVDAQTGEPLPYAKVYTENKTGTLSNSDGYFRLAAHEGTKLKITYIGYQQVECTAAEARGMVRMEPLVNQMGQVTVLAYDMSDLVNQVIKELKNSYKKGKKERGLYFYRITFSNGKRHELVEAFLKANTAVNLRNMAITSGIMAGDEASNEAEMGIKSTNVHRVMEVGAKTFDSYRWQNCIKPFDKVSTFKKFYEASVTGMGEGDEEIIKIAFKEKDKRLNRKGKGLMVGTAYVRASDKRLLRFDGEVLYQFMNSGLSRVPMDFKFNMEYDYSKGYAELSTLAIEGGGEFEPNALSHLSTLNYRTLLFRIAEDSLVQKQEYGLGRDMLSVVKKAGYDSELWNNYEVIRRTEREERIAFGENLITRHMMTDRRGNEYLPHEDSTDNQKINDMLLRQKRFAAMIPQEKVYVHMDNNCYFLGDTIWFAAYTRKTNSDRPSDMSKVLYVELLNHDGYLVERKKLYVQNGCANGFFALNKEIQYSGFYELRAYTRWQLNWGVTERPHSLRSQKWFISKELEKQFFRDYEKLYSRVFPVYDQRDGQDSKEACMTLRPLRRQAYRKKPENPIHINLYPEGGNLVEGLPGRVAFEVCREDGEWVEGTVCLTDGNNDGKDVAGYPTLHRGRGCLEVTPQTGRSMQVCFTSDKGEVVTVPLPQAEKSGASLCIVQEGFAWKIDGRLSPDIAPETTGLVVSHEGKVFAFYSPKAQSMHYLFEPPKGMSGVFQATLFTEDGKVLADRLFFHRSEDMHTATLQIKGVEEKYSPYAPIRLSVEGSEAHRGTMVSLAVREGGTVPGNYDTGNILTEMLLASEIRGFVPEPEWYFERNDSVHRKALDLLMMTQGWRRFRWQDMAVSGNWELTQPCEKHIVLKGRVYPANPADPRLREIEDAQIVLNPEYGSTPIEATQWEDMLHTGNSGKVKTEKKESKRKAKHEYDSEYYLHAQLESGESTVTAHDLKTRNGGTFEAQIPDFPGTFMCYLAATPINKYNPYRKFKWKEMSDPEYLKPRELIKSTISPSNTLVLIDHPYPRFVKPYAYHQMHLRKLQKKDADGKLQEGEDYTELSTVDVTEKSKGLLGFSDRHPAFMLDHFDALNATIDAGLYYALNSQMNTQLGDMGLENISGKEEGLAFSLKNRNNETPSSGKSVMHRMGATPELRLIRTHVETPEDSIYNPKYLMSMSTAIYISDENLRQYLGLGAIDKSIYYTDYSPRLAGDKRYMTDFPTISIAHYPHASGGQYPVYADRCFRLPGFAETASFYSPDYSKQQPDGNTKDYRRTLYWNPNLMLDENGKASVTIYNNSRTTTPVVETAGQAADGTLLWNE